MSKNKVIIIDVGVSNLFNVRRGFEKVGAEVTITSDRKEILDAPRLVLPGVGAFGTGIKNLEIQDLVEPIRSYAKTGKPLLGICLGMQMLLTESEELGTWKGLNIIPGKVVRLQTPQGDQNFKIPEICWNFIERVKKIENGDIWQNSVLDDVGEKPYFYFVHSYVVLPDHPEHALAYTYYGHDKFCSVIQKENVSGCQFHPERSGSVGLRILDNFMKQS